MPLLVRAERPGDVAAIRAVTQAAFSASAFGHDGEAELIDRLRSACPEIVSLVAEREDRLIGHVLFSPVGIQNDESYRKGMGLGPMAVLPEFQGCGIGSALINTGLAMLRDGGVSFVCVLGDPVFYSRFGFQAAESFGIYSEFGGDRDGSFQIQWLNGKPETRERALARYRPEFSELAHNDAKSADKTDNPTTDDQGG
jgi:predicted N-acetyltransferase YhbS